MSQSPDNHDTPNPVNPAPVPERDAAGGPGGEGARPRNPNARRRRGQRGQGGQVARRDVEARVSESGAAAPAVLAPRVGPALADGDELNLAAMPDSALPRDVLERGRNAVKQALVAQSEKLHKVL
ncbi:MAG: hypothetical protein RR784_06095, partial [Burkholderiaceae bacterium]